MYNENPIENLGAFIMAAAIGAGLLLAFQKYGQFKAAQAVRNHKEKQDDAGK